MNHFKTILMTAAFMAVPSIALAQVSTDEIKDKAVDTVLDNATADDAVVAGKTILKGGSKEDAAVAVVKNRAEKKIESVTGGASMDDLNKDGLMKAGKEMAADKVVDKKHDSSTSYSDKAEGSSMSSVDKAKSMIKMNDAPVIPKSDVPAPAAMPTSAPAVAPAAAPTPTAAPLNCPAGTKDAGDGTCMITDDWKP